MRISSALSVLTGFVAARVSPGTVYDDAPLVVVYYDNWAGWIREYSPSHVEKNFLSREMPVRNFVFNYAFFTWNPEDCSLISVDTIDLQKGDQGGWTTDDWNIDTQESWETSKSLGGHLPAFMMLKSKYPHIKLLPSVGGWSRSHTFHTCLLTKMDHMVDSIVDHVTVWGWDGVDFDWEYPNCDGKPCGCQGEAICTPESGFSNVSGAGDWERYKTFVKKVRSAFNEVEDQLGRRLYITAAVGMNPKLIDGQNEITSVALPLEWMCGEDDFDWLNLMTYDFYGPWAQLTGPLAPLYPNPDIVGDQMSLDDSIQRVLTRCSAPHKLTMGLATYGKTWQSVPKEGSVPGLWATSSASDPRSGGTWELGTVSYFDVKKNIMPGCERTWDHISKTPTLYCPTMPLAGDIPFEDGKPVQRGQANTFVTYEDGESWEAKMAYARNKGMAGAIIWAASDTGNGKSYSPDSTADLFAGLFRGWFGVDVPLTASTTLASSPGQMSRWAEYPCPLVTGYSKGLSVIDMSRCQGQTYSPSKTYLKVPTSNSLSAVGKDKVLIHPIGGSVTTTSTTSPTAPTPAPTPATTAASTLPPVTPASTVPSTQAPIHTSTPRPTIPSSTGCPAIPTTARTTVSTPWTTGRPTTRTITTRTTVSTTTSGPATLPTTTTTAAVSLVDGCAAAMQSVVSWADYCAENCSVFYNGPWCGSSETVEALVACVHKQFAFCKPQ